MAGKIAVMFTLTPTREGVPIWDIRVREISMGVKNEVVKGRQKLWLIIWNGISYLKFCGKNR